MTEVADLTTTQIAEYSPTAAALADLRHRFKDVVFDVTTTNGDKEARAARLELVRLRGTLEAKRKGLKAPALERARLIDSEAKRIESEILALEEPIDEAIKAGEQRKEADRRAKIEAEQKRVAAIHERIQALNGPPHLPRLPALLRLEIEKIEAAVIDESFHEFMAQAEAVKAQSIARLQALHTEAVAYYAEAARLKAEREQLDREKAEAEAQRAEQARIDAEARAAEEARLQAERAAVNGRLEKERAEAQAEHDRAMAAERERLQQERLALAQEAAERDRVRREEEATARAVLEAAALAERERRAEAEKARLAAIEDRSQAFSDAAELVREVAATTETMTPAWVTDLITKARVIVARMDATPATSEE